MNRILKNFSYSFISNIIAFIISALITFIVPKKLGIENYGYFQLYIFYSNYTGFLHFGWADGIFLRYGGEYYENLNKERFSGQFWSYCILEIIFGIVISMLGYHCAPVHEKSIILCLIGISIILQLPNTFLQYVLQGTNRIAEYASSVVIEKVVYLFIVLIILVSGTDSFVWMIVADLLGKMSALLYTAWKCHDFILKKPEPIIDIFYETKKNISVGIKLMFATFASMLIIGFVRYAIEYQWDVETFGKVSLTMSVSNLLMLLIRAVSLIIFPVLRRTKSEKLSDIYKLLRMGIMIPLLGMLIFYYPLKVIIGMWLPQYADGLNYMALLFPICIFESKMSMLIETYMKTLRQEKKLMLVNMITVVFSIVLTGITVFALKNLDLAVVSIVVLLAFRCILSEILLSKSISINVVMDIILELIMVTVFICVSWFIGGIKGVVIYMLCYAIYLILKIKDIKFLMNVVLGKFTF